MKKGFTLVELLGVIIVLSIIMVISVPIILNVVNNSQMQKYENDVNELISIVQMHFETGDYDALPGFNFNEDEYNEEYEFASELNFKGSMPISGYIYLSDGSSNKSINNVDLSKIDVVVENLKSEDGKWCANKNYGEKLIVNKCEE